MKVYLHKKRGTVYEPAGVATLQTEKPLEDGAELILYKGLNPGDGQLWAREPSEFFDGRFVEFDVEEKPAVKPSPFDGPLAFFLGFAGAAFIFLGFLALGRSAFGAEATIAVEGEFVRFDYIQQCPDNPGVPLCAELKALAESAITEGAAKRWEDGHGAVWVFYPDGKIKIEW